MSEQSENQFSYRNLSNPARGSFDAVVDDTLKLPRPTRALRVVVGGDVTVHMVDDGVGVNRLIPGVQDGETLSIQCDQILVSGTDVPDPTNFVCWE